MALHARAAGSFLIVVVRVRPMDSNERRVIHLTLAEESDLYTDPSVKVTLAACASLLRLPQFVLGFPRLVSDEFPEDSIVALSTPRGAVGSVSSASADLPLAILTA